MPLLSFNDMTYGILFDLGELYLFSSTWTHIANMAFSLNISQLAGSLHVLSEHQDHRAFLLHGWQVENEFKRSLWKEKPPMWYRYLYGEPIEIVHRPNWAYCESIHTMTLWCHIEIRLKHLKVYLLKYMFFLL